MVANASVTGMTIRSAARAVLTILRLSLQRNHHKMRLANQKPENRHQQILMMANQKNLNLTKRENHCAHFILAFPVDDLPAARKFYTEVLGCTTGREKEESCVFNFYGHQIVAHRVPKMPELSTNPVDGKKVPAMHFGLVLSGKIGIS